MKKQKKSVSLTDAVIQLNVTPSWWPTVHRDVTGPLPLVFSVLTKALSARGIIPSELHFTRDAVVVTVPFDPERTAEQCYAICRSLRSHIEKEITIDASDALVLDPPVPAMTRRELEKVLEGSGFACRAAQEGSDAPDDRDLWHVSSGAMFVQFGDGAGLDEPGQARWGTAGGEELLTYDAISDKIEHLSVARVVDDGANKDSVLGRQNDGGVLGGRAASKHV